MCAFSSGFDDRSLASQRNAAWVRRFFVSAFVRVGAGVSASRQLRNRPTLGAKQLALRAPRNATKFMGRVGGILPGWRAWVFYNESEDGPAKTIPFRTHAAKCVGRICKCSFRRQ